MTYASGKKAWGISDRSGVRFRLRDMRKEWTGLLVGPDEYDPKHPQLFPPKAGNTVFPPVAIIYPVVGTVGFVTVVTT
jgi:hypothetical protein